MLTNSGAWATYFDGLPKLLKQQIFQNLPSKILTDSSLWKTVEFYCIVDEFEQEEIDRLLSYVGFMVEDLTVNWNSYNNFILRSILLPNLKSFSFITRNNGFAKETYANLYHHCPKLDSLDIEYQYEFPLEELKIIVDTVPQLKSLIFDVRHVTTDHIEYISKIECLESLELMSSLNAISLKGLGIIQTLKALSLSSLKFVSFDDLYDCKNICSLDIDDCIWEFISYDQFTPFLSQLEILFLSQIDKPKNNNINLHFMKNMLSKPPTKLKVLCLNGIPLSNDVMEKICELKNLERLALHNCPTFDIQVMKKIVETCIHFKSIRINFLNQTDFDIGLPILRQLFPIWHEHICWTEIRLTRDRTIEKCSDVYKYFPKYINDV